MFKKGDVVLLDTNVIIEADRVNALKPLSDYFELHTVEKVIEETQTGFSKRANKDTIDINYLRKCFAEVHNVDDLDIVSFDLDNPNNQQIDPGEKHLIVCAQLLHGSSWLLNSPDFAVVRFLHDKDLRDKLVSLSAMTTHLNCSLKDKIQYQYTEEWLVASKTRLLMGTF